MIDQRTKDLIYLHLREQCSDEEFAELSEAMRRNPTIREYYLDAAEQDVFLHEIAADSPVMVAREPVPIGNSRSLSMLGWAAAALFMTATCVLGLRLASAPSVKTVEVPGAPQESREAVAALIAEHDCKWGKSSDALAGNTITTGRLHLLEGVADIVLQSGSHLALEGPAILTFHASAQATLETGRMTFVDESSSDAFDLLTPHSTLVDLGTAYAVEVSRDHEEVHVIDGEVWRTDKTSPDDIEFIRAGNARRYVTGDGEPDTIPVSADRFAFPRMDHGSDGTSIVPVAVESFSYTEADALMTKTANGGEGWRGPWSVARPNDSALTTALSPDGALQGRGDFAIRRRLANPIRLDVDATYYASIQFRHAATTVSTQNSFFFLLFGEVPADSRAAFLVRGNKVFNRMIGSDQFDYQPTPNVSQRIVAKIVARKAGPDQVFFTVLQHDETSPAEPRSSWRLASSTDARDDRFTTVGLRFPSTEPVYVHDLRIGPTWQSVID